MVCCWEDIQETGALLILEKYLQLVHGPRYGHTDTGERGEIDARRRASKQRASRCAAARSEAT